jgi:hypothetical protein
VWQPLKQLRQIGLGAAMTMATSELRPVIASSISSTTKRFNAPNSLMELFAAELIQR